jgi:hypothetical protein
LHENGDVAYTQSQTKIGSALKLRTGRLVRLRVLLQIRRRPN